MFESLINKLTVWSLMYDSVISECVKFIFLLWDSEFPRTVAFRLRKVMGFKLYEKLECVRLQ